MVTSLKDVEISHISRYMFAIPFIKKGDYVLDACCGVGYGVKILQDFTYALVEGFDSSEEAIEIGEWNFTSSLTRSSFEKFVTCFPYDVITCFEAIEHVDNPDLLIEKLSSWLKPGGKLIISSPNQTIMPWSAERFPEHKKHFTHKELKDLLESHGLSVTQTYSQQSKFISCINGGYLGRFMILVCEKNG